LGQKVEEKKPEKETTPAITIKPPEHGCYDSIFDAIGHLSVNFPDKGKDWRFK
jgi:hypothetical protein